jgi:hypothetical protein
VAHHISQFINGENLRGLSASMAASSNDTTLLEVRGSECDPVAISGVAQ